MKNEQIELVKKWLADNDRVSPEELKANSRAAYAAAYGADAAAAADGDDYAAAAAYAAAKYWVKRYEELTK